MVTKVGRAGQAVRGHTVVERTTRLPVPAGEAFAWHERAGALERLLPPWERVEILQRDGGIRDGDRVVLRVHAGPLAFGWVARHRDYAPDRQFVDEQVEGPLPYWTHLHRFEPEGPSGCRLTDRIEFAAPLPPVGAVAGLRQRVERMLRYRHELLPADLAAHDRFRDRSPLHVAITGATGLLGSMLEPFLSTGGHRVTAVLRRPRTPGDILWDPATGTIDGAALNGVDAVVHLAGENVGHRWTKERKRRIRESRVRGTRLLAETLARLPRRPRVLVSASGVGIYGNRGDQVLTEQVSTLEGPTDFLVEVGREWEAATEPARAAGIRVVLLRFGIVLTPSGGALARMLPPFRLGVGGPLGSGRQWVSWISADDMVGAIHHALMTDSLAGPVNGTAPDPIRSRDFARTLGRVLGRPALLPAPAAALRLAFGEMGDTALLSSQRALPERLTAAGYRFRYPELEAALRHVLGR